MNLVAYLVPPGVARCQQWGESLIFATGHVTNRGCFAIFMGPEKGAPKDWLRIPPREELPSVKATKLRPGEWVGACGGDVATFSCWEQEKRKLDEELVAARVLGAIAWWGAR